MWYYIFFSPVPCIFQISLLQILYFSLAGGSRLFGDEPMRTKDQDCKTETKDSKRLGRRHCAGWRNGKAHFRLITKTSVPLLKYTVSNSSSISTMKIAHIRTPSPFVQPPWEIHICHHDRRRHSADQKKTTITYIQNVL